MNGLNVRISGNYIIGEPDKTNLKNRFFKAILGGEGEVRNELLFFLRRFGFAGGVRLVLFLGIMQNLLLFQFLPVFIDFFLFLVVFPFGEIIDFVDHQIRLGLFSDWEWLLSKTILPDFPGLRVKIPENVKITAQTAFSLP